jgi:hypothetical protein
MIGNLGPVMSRPTGMSSRTRRCLSISVAGLLALLTFGLEVSVASCAAPTIDVAGATGRRLQVEPGHQLQIVGRYWTLDCFDSGGVALGACGRSQAQPARRARPMEGIRVFLVAPDRTTASVLARGIEADRSLEFRVTVELPRDLPRGRYRLAASSGQFTTRNPIVFVVR